MTIIDSQIPEIIKELEFRSEHEIFKYTPGDLPDWNHLQSTLAIPPGQFLHQALNRKS